jgi:hypothetical protein
MAISIDASEVWSAAGATSSQSYNNTKPFMVVGYGGGSSGDGAGTNTITGATFDGEAATLRGNVTYSYIQSSLFEWLGANIGDLTLAITQTKTNQDEAGWAAVSLKGNKPSPFVAAGSNSGNTASSAALASALTCATGGIIFVAFSARGSAGAFNITTPAGYTEVHHAHEGAAVQSIIAYKSPTGTSEDPTFSFDEGARWTLSAVSYDAVAATNKRPIWFFSKMQDFYDDLKRGLIPPQDLRRRYREVYI